MSVAERLLKQGEHSLEPEAGIVREVTEDFAEGLIEADPDTTDPHQNTQRWHREELAKIQRRIWGTWYKAHAYHTTQRNEELPVVISERNDQLSWWKAMLCYRVIRAPRKPTTDQNERPTRWFLVGAGGRMTAFADIKRIYTSGDRQLHLTKGTAAIPITANAARAWANHYLSAEARKFYPLSEEES